MKSVAIYARVSTRKYICPNCRKEQSRSGPCKKCQTPLTESHLRQDVEMQLKDLREYAQARGWADTVEFVDKGQSGSKDSRPAFNDLMDACRKRKISTLLIWKFDRLFRSLKHLIMTIDELQGLGVNFVSYRDNVDLSTPAGRFQMQILGAVAEFERELIRERITAKLAQLQDEGVVLGAKKKPLDLDRVRELKGKGYSLRAIAKEMGVSTETIRRRG